MSKEYKNIRQYEKEILELKEKGATKREIGEKFGLSKDQIHDFIRRYNRKQRDLAAGLPQKRMGRPPKKDTIEGQATISELKYILARKEAKIKALEMENELMRDFLSIMERK